MPDLSYSPWTEEEVENLNEYQQSSIFHPFTCPCGRNLIVTCNGWICKECEYTQNWAYKFMVDGSFKKVDNYRFYKRFNTSE